MWGKGENMQECFENVNENVRKELYGALTMRKVKKERKQVSILATVSGKFKLKRT